MGAINALEEALRVQPLSWGDVHCFLAIAHERLGHSDEARKWYQEGLNRMALAGSAKNLFVLQVRAEAAEVLGLKDDK
jgi:hypothetical protein